MDETNVGVLIKILSQGDEPILQKILDDVLFKTDKVEGKHLKVLKQFGFCIPAEKKQKTQNSLYFEKDKDSMLPLRDDWFFRPLFYIQSKENKLQQLAQAILTFSEKFILTDANSTFTLTPSDLILLCSHILFQSEDDQAKIVTNEATSTCISTLLDAI